jgi:hypothetical protein
VTRHLLCLTVDTDPDGLSGKVTDRQTLKWEGLHHLQRLPEELANKEQLECVPITWFVRADGQLESILGRASYLLEIYDRFWADVRACGHELGWHPHLYRQKNADDEALLISDPHEARDELERLWQVLQLTFHATAFRNGEGWHTPETYSTVEKLGFRCDSTAIPGQTGRSGHPMNWQGAPNQPYFPSSDDLRKSGPERFMLELPMNTWGLQAPHDDVPRIRYVNPAVHPHLFANALKNWENASKVSPSDLHVWVMIFHPDEVLATRGEDALYSRSIQALCANLISIADSIRRLGHEVEWATVTAAAERWRGRQQ